MSPQRRIVASTPTPFLPVVQAKLRIGEPNDKCEQEADRVADKVMRMPKLEVAGQRPAPALFASRESVQRKCTACSSGGGLCPECEEEEKLRREPIAKNEGEELLQAKPLVQRQRELEGEEEDEELLQTKPLLQRWVNAGTGTPSETPAIVHDVLRSPGRPLDANTRAFMEPRFGHDFRQVRVHTDAKAAAAAKGVNARAFTVGRDVVFGAEHQACTSEGRRLLAHELTHVLQQAQAVMHGSANGVSSIAVAQGEAWPTAASVALGDRVTIRASAPQILYRQTDVDIDSDEIDTEHSPRHEGVTIADWGIPGPLLGGVTELKAQERLPDRFHTADAAITASLQAKLPLAVIEEYGDFYVYLLGYETSFQRFNTTNTLLQPTETPGSQPLARVVSRIPELKALITEDGGILTPTHGVGVLMDHSKNFGEYQSDLQSVIGNSLAFVDGLRTGLPDLQKTQLVNMLAASSNLNAVFPAPFLIGTVEGFAGELVDTLKLLDPREWQAMLGAAGKAAQFLTDPNGREAAQALGVEVGKTMAADVNAAVEKGVIYFSYAIGKLIGPVVVEVVLGLLGIEIGLLSIAGKAVRISGKAIDVLRDGLRASRLLDDIDIDTSRLLSAARGAGSGAPDAAVASDELVWISGSGERIPVLRAHDAGGGRVFKLLADGRIVKCASPCDLIDLEEWADELAADPMLATRAEEINKRAAKVAAANKAGEGVDPEETLRIIRDAEALEAELRKRRGLDEDIPFDADAGDTTPRSTPESQFEGDDWLDDTVLDTEIRAAMERLTERGILPGENLIARDIVRKYLLEIEGMGEVSDYSGMAADSFGHIAEGHHRALALEIKGQIKGGFQDEGFDLFYKDQKVRTGWTGFWEDVNIIESFD